MFRRYLTLALVVEALALAMLSLVAPDVPTLLLLPVLPLTLGGALLGRRMVNSRVFRRQRLSPERLTGGRFLEQHDSPEQLSRSIVERSAEIRRTLSEPRSGVQVEMCALGYRNCVDDMITLTNQVNEELPGAGLPRRLKLHRARRKATEALTSAREALPPGALNATRQERR